MERKGKMESKQISRPSNSEILEDYMLHMKLANRSDNTLESYSRVLEHFFSNVFVSVYELTSDHVLEWLETYGLDKSEATISAWISILSSFFTFCINEEYIENSPIKSRWRPRLPKPIPKYLDKKELAKVRMQS